MIEVAQRARMPARVFAAAALALLSLSGCFGAAGEAEAENRIAVRILDSRGIEWPRDEANRLRFARAIVPGGLFGVAERTSLQQMSADKAHLTLNTDELVAWAEQGARAWRVEGSPSVEVLPAETRIARVMIAAFDGEGGSSYGVGFHDLGLRRNLVLLFVDRKCQITSEDEGGADGVRYALEFPRRGFYWVRTAPGEPIEGVEPDTLSLELRKRGE